MLGITQPEVWAFMGITFQHRNTRSETTLYEILYADDVELVATSSEGLQKLLMIWDEVAFSFGQLISTKKTESMSVNLPTGQVASTLYVKAGGTVDVPIKTVLKFTYLGGLETIHGTVHDEIMHRSSAMSHSFQRLRHILCNQRLHLDTRIQLYNTVVLGSALYGCVSWNITAADMKHFESQHWKKIRQILHVGPRDSREAMIQLAASRNTIIDPLESARGSGVGHSEAHVMKGRPGPIA